MTSRGPCQPGKPETLVQPPAWPQMFPVINHSGHLFVVPLV